MLRLIKILLVGLFALQAQVSFAQQSTWIQVEALSTLREAESRARDYSSAFDNVAGFRLGSGWYAIALGPFESNDARRQLAELKRARIIPSDAYLTDAGIYGQAFWPVGGAAALAPATQPTTPAVQTPTELPDETPSQARASERLLTGEERKALQVSLQWFGFYTARIDGSFGRGTRRSMAAWQQANNFEPTGILTTSQRAVLNQSYSDALSALGLDTVRETNAGIELTMPAKLVEFEKYDYPFVHYTPKDGSGIRILLISQPGGSDRLAGLFNIMQTLEIVPRNGERSLSDAEFTLTGQNSNLHSYTYARAQAGFIKGFTIAYPPEKSAEMQRAIGFMRDTLTPLDGALSPEQTDVAAQSLDLLAGLSVRRPKSSASGFFVSSSGDVLTTKAALGQCERITLGEDTDAQIAATENGLTLLKPSSAIAPLGVAQFSEALPRLRSEIAVSGFSYAGALGAPTVTFGTLEDIRGLQGEDTVQRLSVDTLDGDIGGPVFDMAGLVSGVVMPAASQSRQLPAGVVLSVKSAQILGFLSDAGLSPKSATATDRIAPEDLASRASDVTVLVNCW